MLQPITSATPARHDGERLLHPQRRRLPGLLPARGRGRARHLGPGVGDRLERPVERVRAAGLERHHERLAAGVLHGVGELEDPRVQPVEDLQADAGAPLGAGVAPGPHARRRGGHQRVDVAWRAAGSATPRSMPYGDRSVRDGARRRRASSSGNVAVQPRLEGRLAVGGRGSRRRRAGEGDSSNAE